MEIKPVYEFILWDNCNNHCSFCPQRENCNNLVREQKIKVLHKVDEFLESDKFVKGSHILLVGGEIFDDLSFRDVWQDFLERISYRMFHNEIDLLYVNTNLLYKDLSLLNDLFSWIDYYELWERLKFTTSYDLEGRFATKEKEELFIKNLKGIKKEHPKCNIVVNTILTKKTCECILNDTFNPKEFCDEYKCNINLIPYIIYNEDLSAEPSDVYKSLLHTDYLIDGYLKSYFNNFDLKQDKLLYRYNSLKNEFEYCSSNKLDCGHYENFKLWTKKKDGCFICGLKELLTYCAQG